MVGGSLCLVFFTGRLQLTYYAMCNTDLDNITVLVDSITENSINITLNCYVSEYNRDSSALSLTLMQGEKTISHNSHVHCNTTKHYKDLRSETNYTLLVNRTFYSMYMCELSRIQFITKKGKNPGKS